jgi:hypothetical protein
MLATPAWVAPPVLLVSSYPTNELKTILTVRHDIALEAKLFLQKTVESFAVLTGI